MKFSPRLLAFLAVAIGALAVFGVGLLGRDGDSTARQQASAQSAPAEKHGDDSVWTPSAATTGEADRVALADTFARLWVRPQLGGQSWLAELRPYMTPDLTKQLEGIDPATIPATEVTGAPKKLPGETGQYGIAVTGPEDGAATLVLTVVDVEDVPQVAAIDYLLAGETK